MGNSHDRRSQRRSGASTSGPTEISTQIPGQMATNERTGGHPLVPETKKHYFELGIEFCLELAFGLYQLGAEQMDLPHNFYIGLFLWVAATALAVRMFWIFPKIEKWPFWVKMPIAAVAILAVTIVSWKPVSTAYEKRNRPPVPHHLYTGIAPFHDALSQGSNLPNYFDFDIGGNTEEISRSNLNRPLPILGITPFCGITDPNQMSVWFDETGALLVDATVYDLERNVAATITKNNLDVQARGLDRNYDDFGFEVVTTKDTTVLLQVDHSIQKLIRVRGLFVLRPNYVCAVTDEGMVVVSETPDNANKQAEGKYNAYQTTIRPLFRYPSSQFLHVRND